MTFSAATQHRAHMLLKGALTPDEYRQLDRNGYLDVRSQSDPEVWYRIPRETGYVRIYRRDTPLMDLCLQPAEPLPKDDVILMHRLMIQCDEETYLETAIHYPPWPVQLPTLSEMVRWLRNCDQEG
jgi:hypothetical protein